MSELISRQWLMECVDEGWIKFDTEKDKNRYIHLVRDIAPSAQPKIIHCRECKWVRSHRMFDLEYLQCERSELPEYHVVEVDDFCSRAERRKNE